MARHATEKQIFEEKLVSGVFKETLQLEEPLYPLE